jgi:hypothetical protein
MSKRPLDPSDPLPSQHDHHAAARLPIHDLLSPNDNHSQSGPVKKPRSFIASVVCLPSLRCTVSNPHRPVRPVASRRPDATSPAPNAACAGRWAWSVSTPSASPPSKPGRLHIASHSR